MSEGNLSRLTVGAAEANAPCLTCQPLISALVTLTIKSLCMSTPLFLLACFDACSAALSES